jgi:hypothetical protein
MIEATGYWSSMRVYLRSNELVAIPCFRVVWVDQGVRVEFSAFLEPRLPRANPLPSDLCVETVAMVLYNGNRQIIDMESNEIENYLEGHLRSAWSDTKAGLIAWFRSCHLELDEAIRAESNRING